MRALSESEIKEFINEWTWGTLIAIEGDKPYAIEVSFATDGEFIYCGSMPGGRMSHCIKDNSNVAFKVCDSSKDTSKFRAAIVEGQIKKLTERNEIIRGLRELYKKLGFPDSRIESRADQLTAKPDESSFYRISINTLGGKTIDR
jgi:nitroimidazol reductase NimA-like FMN-containing flavoprotein (pyridoxamine 5'-phosphate oxidase superfamily)